MSEEIESFVPPKRFPEFIDAGNWKHNQLGNVGEIITGKTPSTSDESLWNGDIQFVTPTDISEEKYQWHTQRTIVNNSNVKALPEGSTMFTCIASIGKMSLSVKPCITNQQINSVIPNEYYLKEFIYYSLLNIVPKVKASQANTTLPIINKTDFSKFTIAVPPTKTEQQKIADCLSSLDSLITAQNQKIEALKQHKKGLMQQLFPAEDETIPQLRFPKFENDGEWLDTNFYDLLEEVFDFRGRTPLKLGMDWGGGEVISLSANNVKNGFIDFAAECNLGSEELYNKWMGKVNLERGDIVFTMEAPLGNALLIPDSRKYILSQRVVAFKTKKHVNNSFLLELIWSDSFQNRINQLATGSTAKGINQKTLKKVNIKIAKSSKEQQKIANSLSSLDELISIQIKKLKALKEHKRGLMQQLFPSLDEE